MKEGINLIHITPELLPTIGGIADYTAILSQRLVEVSDEAVKPILVRAGWKEDEPIETELPAKDLSGQCSAEALASTITELAEQTQGKAIVLLEYSGYGYARRGAPLWLLRGLKRICGKKDIPLVTMFHELYATGKPWSSVFWMSPVQRYVAVQLARLSKGVVTNTERSASWLKKIISNETSLHVQPVFSNVGEPESMRSYKDRKSYAVIFGGTGKKALYERYKEDIHDFIISHKIDRIIDIGPSIKFDNLHLNFTIEKKGLLKKEEVAKYLSAAKYGFLCRNPEVLTKSGSLSAYLAYGIPSILGLSDSKKSSNNIKNKKHYYTFKSLSKRNFNLIDWESVSKTGFIWYQSKAHSRQCAKLFKKILNKV